MDFITRAQQLFFSSNKPDVSKKLHQPHKCDHKSKSFRSKYSLGEILGKGTYSIVRKGINLETKEKVAVKCIDEEDLSEKDAKALHREVKILRNLKHKNIISFLDFYYDKKDKMFFIVTEFCGGGEMFDAVVAKTYYSEKKVRKMIACLADAIRYLHVRNITHRDLKPENILLSVPHKKGDFDASSLKIADFGFAYQHSLSNGPSSSESLNTVCGSPIYVAPEILNHHQRSINSKNPADESGYPVKTVDVWSLGVIMFVLLCGYPPFMDSGHASNSNDKLFEKIKSGQFKFEEKYWKEISDSAKDLIKNMLIVDPAKRFTIQQVLRHPWLQGAKTYGETPITVNRTKYIEAKDSSLGSSKWCNLKTAVNKLRFTNTSSSGTLSTMTAES